MRSQIPKPPFPYREIDVSFAGPKLVYAGVLAVPDGTGRHPAVLLISGSGTNYAHLEVPGRIAAGIWYPIMADALARRGTASLRVDSRGIGGTGGEVDAATLADLADDAAAALRFLSARDEVDARHVGVVAISQGGVVAPMAAQRFPSIAFMVLLAAPAAPGRELSLDAHRRWEHVFEKDEGRCQARIAAWERAIGLVQTDADEGATLARMRDAEQAKPKDRRVPDRELQSIVKTAFIPPIRSMIRYDPRPALKQLSMPVLALNGDEDDRINCTINEPALRAALRACKSKDVQIRLLPGFAHQLVRLPRDGGSPADDVDPDVLHDITAWIAAHGQ